jgi:plastocyanin
MHTSHVGWTLLCAMVVVAGCGKDADRQGIVAPNAARADASGSANKSGEGHDADENKRIAILDDCDPTDPGWAPSGGCTLRSGDVSFAEFGAGLSSPLSLSVVGHPAWRMEPSYVESFNRGHSVRVTNEGGRTHTFTEVAQFGGGKIPNPGLNKGLTTAPECPGSVDLAPGASMDLSNLTPGDHRYQCCIHPWMRALVKVQPQQHGAH